MNRISFLKQYIKKPRTIGAILPSSQNLAKKMIEDIDFKKSKYIVEYGPGTGVFTEKLLKNRREDTIILLIEYNYEFYKILKEKYQREKKLYIVNDTAENIDYYLRAYNIPYVDYVISGLPFASLPKNTSFHILDKTKKNIKEDGRFITFQYTLFKKKFINQYFSNIDIKKEYKNLPPAYIFSCKN